MPDALPFRADLALQIRTRVPMRGSDERHRADIFRAGPKTTVQTSRRTAALWATIRDKYNASCKTPEQRVSSIDELLYFVGIGRVQIAPFPVENCTTKPARERPEIPMPAAPGGGRR